MPNIGRRNFITSTCLVGAGIMSGCNAEKRVPSKASKNYVLVHGAWHGGWCWRDVRNRLEDSGHRVSTPTLTGLGERSHLMSIDIGLETHIQDVVNHIVFEDLDDIILVGHSYGGMVITGVVDHLKTRLSHIVYLDAAVPDDGETFASQHPDIDSKTAKSIEDSFRTLSKDGIVMDVLPATLLGIPETDIQSVNWVTKNITPHPLKTWLDPITLKNGGSAGVPRTYIHCVKPVLPQASFAAHYDILRQDPSWNSLTLETGHEAMITLPNVLSDVLLSL